MSYSFLYRLTLIEQRVNNLYTKLTLEEEMKTFDKTGWYRTRDGHFVLITVVHNKPGVTWRLEGEIEGKNGHRWKDNGLYYSSEHLNGLDLVAFIGRDEGISHGCAERIKTLEYRIKHLERIMEGRKSA